jgi:LysR family glycine cleavage system transcriptional activator
MRPGRPNLPSLGALGVFEAVARHMSFTAAARELNVTQAAVSKRIKHLEQELGLALFRRNGRTITLTEQGAALARCANSALDFLEDGCVRLRDDSSRPSVTIAANTAVSHFWLGPRLRRYALSEPSTTVRLMTADHTHDLVDEEHDIAILHGHGERPGWTLLPLFPETLAPVASPQYLDSVGIAAEPSPLLAPEGLASLALLDYEQLEVDWTTLEQWFDWAGVPAPRAGRRQIFSSYALTIEAALSGHGIALGSLPLLSDVLAECRLVRVSDRRWATGRGYYIGVREDRIVHEPVLELLNWLSGPARLAQWDEPRPSVR